jgi:hypothetical protein
MPGTLQLEATARANPMPDSRFQTTNEPSEASTAVQAKGRSGQAFSGRPASQPPKLAMNPAH